MWMTSTHYRGAASGAEPLVLLVYMDKAVKDIIAIKMSMAMKC